MSKTCQGKGIDKLHSLKVIKKTIALKETFKSDYSLYLLKNDFRNFVKLVIRFFENEEYATSSDGKTIQFKFTEQTLKDNGLMPDDYYMQDVSHFYLCGFSDIFLEEQIYVGSEEQRCSSYRFSELDQFDEETGLAIINSNKQNAYDNFPKLKDLIYQLDDIYEIENVFFKRKETICIDELRAREIHDEWN
jgi:hypothetical protein